VRFGLLLPLAFVGVIACNRQPSDLRDWRPSDHDHTTNPGQDQVQPGADAGMSAELAAHGLNEVVLVAWDQSCVRCHGHFGRGDGPQGPMVHAADLSNPRWQATVSDDDIFKVIKTGRGLMPAFPLPDTTLTALVKLVRLLGQVAAAAESDSAAPAPSGSAPRAVNAGPGGTAAHGASAAPSGSVLPRVKAAPASSR
jgi:mono/diheme cytochrome c family protein